MSADIRVDTPEDFRLEQTVNSRALCLNWCKNIKNEHLRSRGKSGIMFTEDGSAFEIPPVGVDIGRPCRTAKAGTSVNTAVVSMIRAPTRKYCQAIRIAPNNAASHNSRRNHQS